MEFFFVYFVLQLFVSVDKVIGLTTFLEHDLGLAYSASNKGWAVTTDVTKGVTKAELATGNILVN